MRYLKAPLGPAGRNYPNQRTCTLIGPRALGCQLEPTASPASPTIFLSLLGTCYFQFPHPAKLPLFQNSVHSPRKLFCSSTQVIPTVPGATGVQFPKSCVHKCWKCCGDFLCPFQVPYPKRTLVIFQLQRCFSHLVQAEGQNLLPQGKSRSNLTFFFFYSLSPRHIILIDPCGAQQLPGYIHWALLYTPQPVDQAHGSILKFMLTCPIKHSPECKDIHLFSKQYTVPSRVLYFAKKSTVFT